MEVWTQRVPCKVKGVTYFAHDEGVTYFARDPLRSYFHEPQKNEKLFLKWNGWLTDITFDWRHVMEKAIERNNRTLRLITFLRQYFTIFTAKLQEQWTKIM